MPEPITPERRAELLRAASNAGFAGVMDMLGSTTGEQSGGDPLVPGSAEHDRLMQLAASAGLRAGLVSLPPAAPPGLPVASPTIAPEATQAAAGAPASPGVTVQAQSGATVNVGGQGPAQAAPAPSLPPLPRPPLPSAPPMPPVRRVTQTQTATTGVPQGEVTIPASETREAALQTARALAHGAREAVGIGAEQRRILEENDQRIQAELARLGEGGPEAQALAREAQAYRQATSAAARDPTAARSHVVSVEQAIGMGLGALGQMLIGARGQIVSNPAADAIEAEAQRTAQAEQASGREGATMYAALVRQLGQTRNAEARAAQLRISAILQSSSVALRALAGQTQDTALAGQLMRDAASLEQRSLDGLIAAARAEHPEQTATTTTTFERAPAGGGRGVAAGGPATGIDEVPLVFRENMRLLQPDIDEAGIVHQWNITPPVAQRSITGSAGVGAATRVPVMRERLQLVEESLDVPGFGRAVSTGAAQRARDAVAAFGGVDAALDQLITAYDNTSFADRASARAGLPLSTEAQTYRTMYTNFTRELAIAKNKGALSQADVDAITEALPMVLGFPRTAFEVARRMARTSFDAHVRAMLSSPDAGTATSPEAPTEVPP